MIDMFSDDMEWIGASAFDVGARLFSSRIESGLCVLLLLFV